MDLINREDILKRKVYTETEEGWSGYTINADIVENAPQVKAVPIEVLQEIRQEIESNMESIIGKYDSSTPKRDMPSVKIGRNEGRQECLDIIDKHLADKRGNADGTNNN